MGKRLKHLLLVCIFATTWFLSPQVAKVAQVTTDITLSADTYIVENSASTNYGSQDQMIVTLAGAKGATNRIPYIKFTIPSGLNISSLVACDINLKISTTNLNQSSGGKGPNDEVLVVYETSTSWNENSITWNNAPGRGNEITRANMTKEMAVGDTVTIDILDYIKTKSAGSTISLRLEFAATASAGFYTKEHGTSSNRPFVRFVTGDPLTPPSVTAQSPLGGNLRLESLAERTYYIRSTSSGVAVNKNVSPLTDARFKETSGFVSGTGYVALESVSRPGYYLRKVAGRDVFTLSQNDGSNDFKQNATFKKVQGLGSSSGVSYQLLTNTNKFIKVMGTSLSAGKANTTLDKNQATFLVRQEKNAYMADEFNGSSLNTNIWAYNYPWGTSHNHSGIARESQVSVANGVLTLTAVRVADDNWIQNHKGEVGYWDSIGDATWRKYSHLTGVIHLPFSRYPLNKNCYIEGSFKMPNRSGFWPAFWLNGNYSWPPEIDIFEYLSNTPEKIYVGIHRYNSSYPNNDEGYGWWITQSASYFQNSFRKYAIDWNEKYINYYIDDILVRSVETQSVVDNQQNMYMIINLGVGGWATEPTDNPGDTTTLQCDYVRIYNY